MQFGLILLHRVQDDKYMSEIFIVTVYSWYDHLCISVYAAHVVSLIALFEGQIW